MAMDETQVAATELENVPKEDSSPVRQGRHFLFPN